VNYFDTTYLVRLYIQDPGWDKVRELAAHGPPACSALGKAETIAALHRKFREGGLDRKSLSGAINEFEKDSAAGAFFWFPLSEKILERVTNVYKTLSPECSLRAADAIHLGTAAENQFRAIYSNDRRLLGAAADFGLQGINVIG
jgi:predicted nucleic acid-binding protein